MGKRFRHSFRELLCSGGFTELSKQPVNPKVAEAIPSLNLALLEVGGRQFVLTEGCSGEKARSDADSELRISNEFIVDVSSSIAHAVELANYVAFYHATCRFIDFADLLDLGTSFKNPGHYSTIYCSLPFFVEQDFSKIVSGEDTIRLIWCQGVLATEVEFIRDQGAKAFEEVFYRAHEFILERRVEASYLPTK